MILFPMVPDKEVIIGSYIQIRTKANFLLHTGAFGKVLKNCEAIFTATEKEIKTQTNFAGHLHLISPSTDSTTSDPTCGHTNPHIPHLPYRKPGCRSCL